VQLLKNIAVGFEPGTEGMLNKGARIVQLIQQVCGRFDDHGSSVQLLGRPTLNKGARIVQLIQ
jgi:hypothetical protein